MRATVSDSGSVIKDVERGRASIGLIGQKAEKPALETRPIGRDSLVLLVPLGHPWATRRSVSLDALVGEPLIVRESGSGSRCALEKSLERARRSLAELNVSLELGSNVAIKDAVKRGLGVAFLSRLCAQRELGSEELRAVAVRGLCLTRHFYLVYHRHRPLSQASSVFLHFIESHPISQHPARQAISQAYGLRITYQKSQSCQFFEAAPPSASCSTHGGNSIGKRSIRPRARPT